MKVLSYEGERQQRGIKVLLYGKPGVGKTVLAAQAPRPTLIFDFDQGAGFVHGAQDEKGRPLVDLNDLFLVRDMTMADLESLSEALALGQPPEGFDFNSIVIDTLSQMQISHRESILGPDKLTAAQRDWGVNAEWCRRVIYKLQKWSGTCVYVCHEALVTDEGRQLRMPDLSPALRKSVEGYVDAQVYLNAIVKPGKEGGVDLTRVAYTVPFEGVQAKDRTSLLPQRVEAPTWEDLFGAWYAAKAPITKKGGK